MILKKSIVMTLMIMFVMTLGLNTLHAEEKEGKININDTTKEALMKVPEMTEEIADSILERVKETGGFVDLMELMDIEAMTPSLMRQFKRFLYVEEVAGCNC